MAKARSTYHLLSCHHCHSSIAHWGPDLCRDWLRSKGSHRNRDQIQSHGTYMVPSQPSPCIPPVEPCSTLMVTEPLPPRTHMFSDTRVLDRPTHHCCTQSTQTRFALPTD